MDPVYNFNVAKATVGAALHFAKASTATLNVVDNKEYGVSFFPNPFKDVMYVNIGDLNENQYMFSIIDINGKTIFSKFVENSNQLEAFNLESIPSGIYLGVLETNGKRITKKIVKE